MGGRGWASDTWDIQAGLVHCGQLYPRDNVDSIDMKTGKQSRVGVGFGTSTQTRHDSWSFNLERASWGALGSSAIEKKLGEEGEGSLSIMHISHILYGWTCVRLWYYLSTHTVTFIDLK